MGIKIARRSQVHPLFPPTGDVYTYVCSCVCVYVHQHTRSCERDCVLIICYCFVFSTWQRFSRFAGEKIASLSSHLT